MTIVNVILQTDEKQLRKFDWPSFGDY